MKAPVVHLTLNYSLSFAVHWFWRFFEIRCASNYTITLVWL